MEMVSQQPEHIQYEKLVNITNLQIICVEIHPSNTINEKSS